MCAQRTVVCAAAVLLTACAGDGEGLDENGRPIGSAQEPLLPEFSSIQNRVFTPFCTQCHAGAAAPLGLRLDEGAAYAMLVNAPSIEVPALRRVAPGDPDASYLIQKLEGIAAVGGRMPLNGPPLSAETIATVRQWITDGAQPSATALSLESADKPAEMHALWPLPGGVLRAPMQIVLSASRELDTTLIGAGLVTVRRADGNGDFGGAEPSTLAAAIAVRSLDPTVIVVTPSAAQWASGEYELRVSGTGPLALADRGAIAVDGDGDSEPGGDFVLRFTVEGQP